MKYEVGLPGACKQYLCPFADKLVCREVIQVYTPLALIIRNLYYCYAIKLLNVHFCCIQSILTEKNMHKKDGVFSFKNQLRGFVKLKKIQKPKKNSEVGGWVKSLLGFVFFGGKFIFFCVFCVVFMFPCVFKLKKKMKRGWVGWV